MKTAAIILAGGKSRRLGRNKALEPILGKRLIDQIIERIQPLASQILIVTSREQFHLFVGSKAEILVDIRLVPDCPAKNSTPEACDIRQHD